MSRVRRLVLRSFQSPGDIVMLTAAVRDLHAACPGEFVTDVRTSSDALWQHNPWITRLSEGQPDVETLDMHYPLIHQCNQRPYHFLHGYIQYLEQQLQRCIPVTAFRGDVHLSAEEKQTLLPALLAHWPQATKESTEHVKPNGHARPANPPDCPPPPTLLDRRRGRQV